MSEQLYRYVWKNNSKRASFYGRTCRLIARGSRNTVELEFLDNGERTFTSGNSIRKLKGPRMENITEVFDVIDVSDEDVFFPLGIFLSLKAAKEALKTGPSDEWESDSFRDSDICTVEVRKRPIGFGGIGRPLLTISWEQEYNEEKDEFFWSEGREHENQSWT